MGKPLCFCRAVKVTLITCRLLGFCPISWRHENGNCTFKVSPYWVIHSLIYAALNILYLTQVYKGFFIAPEYSTEFLLDYVSTLNQTVTSSFIVVFIFLNLVKCKKIANAYTECGSLRKEDLLCQTSLKYYHRAHVIFNVSLFALFLLQYGIILVMNFIDFFDTNWNYDRFLLPLIQNTSFICCALIGSACSIINTALGCVVSRMRVALNYTPVHPLPGFNEINTSRTMINVLGFNICNANDHPNAARMQTVKSTEYFRWLYDQIRMRIKSMNDCFSPQILIYMAFEVVSMVFHWYAVIIFFTYKSVSPTDSTNNLFNWLFVVVHTTALVLFLSVAQQIEEACRQITNILMEYSTRISSVEEHQQIRVFLQTLKTRIGLNASGIFNVNLGIIAPISANILMYVLVAVQFKFPGK